MFCSCSFVLAQCEGQGAAEGGEGVKQTGIPVYNEGDRHFYSGLLR